MPNLLAVSPWAILWNRVCKWCLDYSQNGQMNAKALGKYPIDFKSLKQTITLDIYEGEKITTK